MAKTGGKTKIKAGDKKTHLRKEDLYAIVVWLQHKANFEKCFGVAGKPVIGKQSTKLEGFRDMALALASSSKGLFRLKPYQMRDRFTTYKNRYMKAKTYEDTTGAGVTSDDEERGVYTLQQKLERMCPWYEQMKALFDSKANVTPLGAFDSTASGTNFELTGEGSDVRLDIDNIEEISSAVELEFTQSQAPVSPSSNSQSDSPSSPSPSDYTILAQRTPDYPVSQASNEPESILPSTLAAENAPGVLRKRVSSGAEETAARASKTPRAAQLPTLNQSPGTASGSGNRIATAMKLAAESKAVVEKKRLDFDRERWAKESETRFDQQELERERFAFEKAKWEKEREDHRAELLQKHRFEMINSLIEKGRTPEEAEQFLSLLEKSASK